MAKRPPLLPLLTHLARLDGDMETHYPPPVPYSEPFVIEFFAPGRPRAKDRGTPRPCAGGKGAYIFTSQEVQDKEKYVREEFLRHVHAYYRNFAQFLPITEGWCWFEVYSLMPPPANWYPGLPHTGPPDGDNLYKLIKDALSGRASGRPPLAFRDDSMSAGAFPQWKSYWDERFRDTPGYPPCPGTHVAIHYEVTPRNPELLPEGVAVCKMCGSDKFRTLAGLAIHERSCKSNGSI